MRPVDVYLKNQSVNINDLESSIYNELEGYYTNYIMNLHAANEVLKESNFSPYSTDYKYLYFKRESEIYKAKLDDKISQIKQSTRAR